MSSIRDEPGYKSPGSDEPLYPDVSITTIGVTYAEHLIGRVFVALFLSGYQDGACAFARAAVPLATQDISPIDTFFDVKNLAKSYVEVT